MVVCAQTCGRPPIPRLLVVSWRVHVFQDQFAWLDLAPLVWVDNIHVKFFDGVRNFSHAPRQCGSNRRTTFAAVHSSQRLDSALRPWNDGLAARPERTRKQPVEPFYRKVRQVACNDQIPARVRCGQGGGDSRQRPTPESIRPVLSLRIVRDCAQSQLRVFIRRSDNCYPGDDWLEQSSHMQNHWDAPEIEESLVAAHARAGASRKNESSDLAIAFHDCPLILRLPLGLAQSSGGL